MGIKQDILAMVTKRDSRLPSLSGVIKEILSAASKEKTTTDALADIIAKDPDISAKLIKLANSGYYAQKTKVETLKRSISAIGFDEVIGIALSIGILSSFTDKSGMGLDMKALWIHSIGVATMSKSLAMRSNPGIAGKIFIPALLHDMGKVILSFKFKEDYIKVRHAAIETKKTLYQTENTIFEIDHAALLSLLMKRWQFPESIMIPCRFHHSPESCPTAYRHQAMILNLADYLTQKAGIGHSGNPIPVTVKNAAQKIGLADAVLKMNLDQLKRKEKEIKDFFIITTEA